MQALQEHLSRWLMGYALAAMGLGVGLGRLASEWTASHDRLVASSTTAMVFLVIYPMMVGLKFEALLHAGHHIKGLALALAFNFVWAPLLGLALAKIFLPDPLLAIGFLLVMVVPCSSMTIAYTGLAKGNVALATMAVALTTSSSRSVAVPAWMLVFASGYDVQVPIADMLTSIGTVLIAPMILGFATRKFLTSTIGPTRFARLQPIFPIASMLAMFAIIFLIFFGKADLIVDKWSTVVLLLVPNALFIAITLLAVTWLDHRLNLRYGDHMAVVFASTGKNNGTAIAIAATAFSPLVAVPAATMPIFQVLLLIGYLKIADRVRAYFIPDRGNHPPTCGNAPGERPHQEGIVMTSSTNAAQPTLGGALAGMPTWLNDTLPAPWCMTRSGIMLGGEPHRRLSVTFSIPSATTARPAPAPRSRCRHDPGAARLHPAADRPDPERTRHWKLPADGRRVRAGHGRGIDRR